MDIIDISMTIKEGMKTYPGNPEVKITPIKRPNTRISKIEMGTHTGTHIDPPSHVFADKASIDEINLEHCIGPCKVFDLTEVKEQVEVSDLKSHFIEEGDRILLKTRNSLNQGDTFNEAYVSLSGDVAEWLEQKGIRLIGVDALSIKKRGDEDTRAHDVFLEKDITIVEGLDLSHVDEGEYTLVVLPIKISEGDGGPARAVLLPMNSL